MRHTSIGVLSILACAMTFAASCSDKAETNPVSATVDVTETTAGSRIAYFDADTVMHYYPLAQELTEEGQRMMNRFQQQAAQKQRELEAQAANIERKRQNNIYLSEASFNHDVQELQNAQAQAERVLNAQQNQIQMTIAESQARLNDSITNAARFLCQQLGYDAVFIKDNGIYFNPALDITRQMITVLNNGAAGAAAAATAPAAVATPATPAQ